ncbi:MAG: exodeoxyribonuclease VII large subunit, partial [Christensenellaceae bacterium]|nr:exodeoxyribonuclease VII large subunit [Christensenellaceae bacterium]
MNDFLTVGQLITCINSALTSEPSLRNCAVLGEVSALQVREPHIYFQLKDTEGCIDCALFGYKRQSFVPKAGDKIIAIGTPDVYRVNGKLSFKIVKISLFGIGELLKKIEE